MTRDEYEYLQIQLFEKLDRSPGSRVYSGNKLEAYRDGVRACKSILKDFFQRSNESGYATIPNEYKVLLDRFSKKMKDPYIKRAYGSKRIEAYQAGIHDCMLILKQYDQYPAHTHTSCPGSSRLRESNHGLQ